MATRIFRYPSAGFLFKTSIANLFGTDNLCEFRGYLDGSTFSTTAPFSPLDLRTYDVAAPLAFANEDTVALIGFSGLVMSKFQKCLPYFSSKSVSTPNRCAENFS